MLTSISSVLDFLNQNQKLLPLIVTIATIAAAGFGAVWKVIFRKPKSLSVQNSASEGAILIANSRVDNSTLKTNRS
jgi:hypothetical protein